MTLSPASAAPLTSKLQNEAVTKLTCSSSLADVEMAAELVGQIDNVNARVAGEGIADLIELFEGAEGQVEEDPCASPKFATSAADTPQELVPYSVTEPPGGIDCLFQQFNCVHHS